QLRSLSRLRKLSIMPWTICRNVQNFPLTGSSNLSSQLAHAYFFRVGVVDSRSTRRAVSASVISGRNSRVSVLIVCSTSMARPFTFLVPKSSGNPCRMSLRITNDPPMVRTGILDQANCEIDHHQCRVVKPPADLYLNGVGASP